MQGELFPQTRHLLFAVDSRKRDFIVYNDRELSNDPIDLSQLQYGTMEAGDEQRSEAWSSNVKWFFVIQDDGIYLLNAHNKRCVFCPQHSYQFIELLQAGLRD